MPKTIAYKSILADYGIEITSVDGQEGSVTFRWREGERTSPLKKSTLRCDYKGRYYFCSRRDRHYLNEFLKTSI